MNNHMIRLFKSYEVLKKQGLPSTMIKETLLSQAKRLGISKENIEKAKEKEDPIEIISILAQKSEKKHIIPLIKKERKGREGGEREAQETKIAKKHIIELLGGQIIIKEGDELEIWIEIDEPSNYEDVKVHFGQIMKISGKPMEV